MRIIGSRAFYSLWVLSLIGVWCTSCKQGGRSQSNTKTVEFRGLAHADRIEVRGIGDKLVRVVTDPDQIATAANFIARYQAGWVDVWSGPGAPWLLLNFYQGQQYVGGFGISESYLVAGTLSQNASPDQITPLAKRLDLDWPPRP